MKISRGFSLVEMMVAVALFSIVMMVSSSALLALIDATKKAQSLQSVMGNLNTALDGMVRAIRMGGTYHCGTSGLYTAVQDCGAGDTLLAFEPYGGNTSSASDQWVYQYDALTQRLYKSEAGGAVGTFYALTAPEVQIEDFKFYVVGSTPGDSVQPKVVITVRGTAGAEKTKTRTTFNIQATATQRLLDL